MAKPWVSNKGDSSVVQHENAAQRPAGKPAKASITAHRGFPAVVAIWFAALLGIGSAVLPITLIERAATASGLASVVSAAQPPLGMTARALIALAAAFVGGLLGLLVARRAAAQAGGAASKKPARFPGRNHHREPAPDLPVKRPISAREELGSMTLDDPVDAAGSPDNAAPAIPGRRRALSVTEESGRSEFLDEKPELSANGAFDAGFNAAHGNTGHISEAVLDGQISMDDNHMETFGALSTPELQLEPGFSTLDTLELEPAENPTNLAERQVFQPSANLDTGPFAKPIQAERAVPEPASEPPHAAAEAPAPDDIPMPDNPFTPEPPSIPKEQPLDMTVENPQIRVNPAMDDGPAGPQPNLEDVQPHAWPVMPASMIETEITPDFASFAEPMDTPAAPEPPIAGDAPVSAGPSLADLVERFSQALQARDEAAAKKADTTTSVPASDYNPFASAAADLGKVDHPFAAPTAQANQPAARPEPEIETVAMTGIATEEPAIPQSYTPSAVNAPPVPAALRPIPFDLGGHELDDDLDADLADDDFPDLSLSLGSSPKPFAAPQPDTVRGDIASAFPVAENDPSHGGPDAKTHAADESIDAFSSLLAVKNPAGGGRNFVRIEEDEAAPDDDAPAGISGPEPVVVFPGSEPGGPARPVSNPEQRFDGHAYAPAAAAMPASTRSFQSSAMPAMAAPDRDTEQALREALEKLQRMSGAA